MIKFTKDGNYGCFSNFYICGVDFQGLHYSNTEAAWQSQKTLDPNTREKFCVMTPSAAKSMGRRIDLRPDWEDVKYQLMVDCLYAKFTQNDDCKALLLSTGDEFIVENTTGWHDNIWGNCECLKCKNIEGKNLLGKALVEVRTRLKNE